MESKKEKENQQDLQDVEEESKDSWDRNWHEIQYHWAASVQAGGEGKGGNEEKAIIWETRWFYPSSSSFLLFFLCSKSGIKGEKGRWVIHSPVRHAIDDPAVAEAEAAAASNEIACFFSKGTNLCTKSWQWLDNRRRCTSGSPAEGSARWKRCERRLELLRSWCGTGSRQSWERGCWRDDPWCTCKSTRVQESWGSACLKWPWPAGRCSSGWSCACGTRRWRPVCWRWSSGSAGRERCIPGWSSRTRSVYHRWHWRNLPPLPA